MIKIAPSMLSADFANMGRDAALLEEWGADMIHFDVMDGTFVPTITFGPAMCEAIGRHTKLPIDVHIMVEHPETYIDQFAKAGAAYLTAHVESTNHIHRTLQLIRSSGMKAGVAINPGTPVESIKYVLGLCDIVLVMSVNPGAGGQKFLYEILPKLDELVKLREEHGYAYEIEVDGGIKPGETASLVIKHGATMLVSGSGVFSSSDKALAIAEMRKS